jgi:hypothetical protein
MLIALLLMAISATGCSTTKAIEYCEPVTVYQDRYVPIPVQLTNPIEVAGLEPDFDLIDLGTAYKVNRTRALQCNGRLAEISRIGQSE